MAKEKASEAAAVAADPVLAELLKRREQTLARLNAKITERKRRMQGQERRNRFWICCDKVSRRNRLSLRR